MVGICADHIIFFHTILLTKNKFLLNLFVIKAVIVYFAECNKIYCSNWLKTINSLN